MGGQGLGLFQRGLPAFHGVDDMVLDGGNVGLGKFAVQCVDFRGTDQRPLALGNDLDTLMAKATIYLGVAFAVITLALAKINA